MYVKSTVRSLRSLDLCPDDGRNMFFRNMRLSRMYSVASERTLFMIAAVRTNISSVFLRFIMSRRVKEVEVSDTSARIGMYRYIFGMIPLSGTNQKYKL
jgi:hypothetical protein